MLSKNKIKLIQSLKLKKYRQKYNNFIAEGEKIVSSLIFDENAPVMIVAKEDWWKDHQDIKSQYADQAELCDDKIMKQISQLKTPSSVLAIFKIPEHKIPREKADINFYLDGIQDPGNLGTIIRTLDWFGIDRVYLSQDCVDPFNAKVVQSCMGSVLRLKYLKVDMTTLKQDYHLYGAHMDGKSYKNFSFQSPGMIVIGNEGHGIRSSYLELLEDRISIPKLSKTGVESLNAAISVAILCAEIKKA